jgi:hypothetical protein
LGGEVGLEAGGGPLRFFEAANGMGGEGDVVAEFAIQQILLPQKPWRRRQSVF